MRQSEEAVGERGSGTPSFLRRLEGGHEAVGLVVAGRHLLPGSCWLGAAAGAKFAPRGRIADRALAPRRGDAMVSLGFEFPELEVRLVVVAAGKCGARLAWRPRRARGCCTRPANHDIHYPLNPLHDWPDDILLAILGHAERASLCAARAVSSRWREVASSDVLWAVQWRRRAAASDGQRWTAPRVPCGSAEFPSATKRHARFRAFAVRARASHCYEWFDLQMGWNRLELELQPGRLPAAAGPDDDEEEALQPTEDLKAAVRAVAEAEMAGAASAAVPDGAPVELSPIRSGGARRRRRYCRATKPRPRTLGRAVAGGSRRICGGHAQRDERLARQLQAEEEPRRAQRFTSKSTLTAAAPHRRRRRRRLGRGARRSVRRRASSAAFAARKLGALTVACRR